MRPLRPLVTGLFCVSLVISACSDPAPVSVDSGQSVDAGGRDVALDAGSLDAGSADAGSLDAGSADAGSVDAGALDAATGDLGARDGGVDGGPLGSDAGADGGAVSDAGAGLGALSGMCGTLRTMLRSPAPSLVRNAMQFRAGEMYVRGALSPEAQRIFDTPNAGGSSTESEVLSFELLRRCEGASLVATETEVMYTPPDDAGANSITDILLSIDGQRVGVSVTRAYRPRPMMVTEDQMRTLLTEKLNGINRSTQRVLPAQAWVKQILHVWAVDEAAAGVVERVWPTLSASLRADTIVLLTVSSGGGFLYCNPDPPLGSECPSL
ncbi:MAG: hypothetical protein JNK72_26535 [Myxococcales bacterium]|nr:hypothetical protein [Myxococcales bacterium]